MRSVTTSSVPVYLGALVLHVGVRVCLCVYVRVVGERYGCPVGETPRSLRTCPCISTTLHARIDIHRHRQNVKGVRTMRQVICELR